MMDMSEYLINAFRDMWGGGTFEKDVDESGNPMLNVRLIGMSEFSIDLRAAEHAILEEGVTPEDYAASIVESSKLDSILESDDDEDENDRTFDEIALAMDIVIESLIALDYISDDTHVGDPVIAEDDPQACEGLWINIGIHPVPFLFADAWKNLIHKKRSPEEYVKEVIIRHVGKLPY